MTEKTVYIARDGKEFFSKSACHEYEKRLDEKERRGTIAEVLDILKKEKGYVSGMMLWLHDNHSSVQHFTTVNIAGPLSRYTDISKLTEKEKYFITTVEDAIKMITARADEKDLCQYALYFSEKLDGSYGHLTSNYNNELWDELNKLPQDQKETCPHIDLHPYGE